MFDHSDDVLFAEDAASKKETGIERLTCNQLILLLEIFRGTEDTANVLGTYFDDMQHLLKLGLIEIKAATKLKNHYVCTQKAHDYIGEVQNLLKNC